MRTHYALLVVVLYKLKPISDGHFTCIFFHVSCKHYPGGSFHLSNYPQLVCISPNRGQSLLVTVLFILYLLFNLF